MSGTERADGSGDDRPLLIGITGPLGCGKSTVAGMLADVGATVIDADALAREATGPDEPGLAAIRERFGATVFHPDGTLDRPALASIVFDDRDALADLEAIVHPQVRRRVEAELDAATAAGAPIVVVEAIKLVEGGLAERCDEVWVIDCPPDVQRRRALARGIAQDDLDRRLSAQGPGLAERLSGSATRRIPTDGTLDQTRERVEDALADALAPRWLEPGRDG